MRFDLIDLRLFVAVATSGNITKAARETPIALAAASARIKGLEERLRTPLFERTARGVILTEAGKAFHRRALDILSQVAALDQELVAIGKGTTATIRLHINTTAREHVLEALPRFLAQHPSIFMDLQESSSPEILQAVSEGKADLGIVGGDIRAVDLTIVAFRSERVVIVVPAKHDLARRKSIRLDEALNWDFVGLGSRSAVQGRFNQAAVFLGREARYRFHVEGFEEVCRTVAQGVGLGLASETVAKRLMRSVPIAIVQLEEEWAVRDLKLVAPPTDSMPPYSKLLLDFLAQAAAGKTSASRSAKAAPTT